jgi:hypothetical protein
MECTSAPILLVYTEVLHEFADGRQRQRVACLLVLLPCPTLCSQKTSEEELGS